MLRHLLRGLAVAVGAAFTLGPVPAAATTPVSACQPLDKAGETYILTTDIGAGGDCFQVLADRITLDLAGHTITGLGVNSGTNGVWDSDSSRALTVVKNGTIKSFTFGILFGFSTRSIVRGVTTSDNDVGIFIGPNSLVKDCIVQRHRDEGIDAAEGVQVEGCLIGGGDSHGTSLGKGGPRLPRPHPTLPTNNTPTTTPYRA